MTIKELKEHQWKEGEIIYKVASRLYEYFDIPTKVIRLKVTQVGDKWFYVKPCNKKDINIIRTFGYWYAVSSRTICSDIFFKKQEAVKFFNEKYDEFKKLHASQAYRRLINRLNELDAEKQEVWGVMRMKIFKQDE